MTAASSYPGTSARPAGVKMNSVKRWLKLGYPQFVCPWAPRKDEDRCPVFAFHSVTVRQLRPMFQYLARNGYKTVSLDDYAQWKQGKKEMGDKSIVLTFDDGRASLWTVAEPLLEEFGFTAAAFIVPGQVKSGRARKQWNPSLSEADTLALESEDKGTRPLVSWQELQLMRNRGTVDIQSHSLFHQRIFVSGEITDVWTPALAAKESIQWEYPRMNLGGKIVPLSSLPWGTPLFRHEPRMRAEKEIILDGNWLREAADFFNRSGGESMLRDKDGLKKYRAHLEPMIQFQSESDEEQERAIYEELLVSRQTLEENFGKPVRHLCFPWGEGSELAVRMARKAGYEMICWDVAPLAVEDAGILSTERLHADWIWRLTGAGRAPALEFFWNQFRKRLRKETDY